MSATATTTFSDTLVVGRQPQQSVGVRSVSPSFPPPLHPSHISGPFSPSSIPIATRKSNGLDPQFTSANRPGGVRFSPRTRLNKHAPSSDLGHHHHPWCAACSLRPRCTEGSRGLEPGAARRDRALHVEAAIDSSTQRPVCVWAEGRQREDCIPDE